MPGDELEVRGPIGGFFVWDGERPALLVGGGSGVVPLMAMLRQARRAGRAELVRLVVSVRSPEDLYYADELPGPETTVVYTRQVPPGSGAAGRPVAVADVAPLVRGEGGRVRLRLGRVRRGRDHGVARSGCRGAADQGGALRPVGLTCLEHDGSGGLRADDPAADRPQSRQADHMARTAGHRKPGLVTAPQVAVPRRPHSLARSTGCWSASLRYISAAARENPSGTPTACSAAAASSISPAKRHALLAAAALGPSRRAGSTPIRASSARSSSRHPVAVGGGGHGQPDRRQRLALQGEAGLERAGRAQLVAEHVGVERGPGEQRRHRRRGRPGQPEHRVPRLPRRRPDDRPVHHDVRPEPLPDGPHRARRHRVRVQVERPPRQFGEHGRHPPGHVPARRPAGTPRRSRPSGAPAPAGPGTLTRSASSARFEVVMLRPAAAQITAPATGFSAEPTAAPITPGCSTPITGRAGNPRSCSATPPFSFAATQPTRAGDTDAIRAADAGTRSARTTSCARRTGR